MVRIRKGLYYAGYAVVTAIFFLYYLFPSQAVRAGIQQAGARLHPDLELRIADLRPSPMFGLALDTVVLRYRQLPLLTAAAMTVHPQLTSLLRGDLAFQVTGRVNGGQLEATVNIDHGASPASIRLAGNLRDIELNRMPLFQAVTGRQWNGALSSSFRYPDPPGGDAVGMIIGISDAVVSLKPSAQTARPLNFEQIEATVHLAGHKVRVDRCRLKGNDITGSISGTVFLADSTGDSRLDLSGRMALGPALLADLDRLVPDLAVDPSLLRGGMPFRLTGTLDKPGYTLN